ncbi:MAG: hypothetical protein HPY55_05410 [Firmicutes bacterium]|nr:hypothetical protein [Bacillota bacterium]
MSKVVNQPVLVITDAQVKPAKFFWRRWFRVSRIMDTWAETGRWWEGEPERVIYRVISDGGMVAELEACAGRWVLYKIYD